MSFLRSGLVAIGVGAALWCSLGALGVTGFSSVSRIGLLPPFWALLPAVLLVAALAFWPFARGRDSLARARPAALFSIFAVLPWLPIVVPAPFLIWVGPMSALLWGGALASALALARPRWPRSLSHLLTDGKRAPWVAGALALAVYAGGVWQLADRVPGGDEPHYLIIADSLRRDGDLQIENNHRERQYLTYIDGELKPDYLRRGANGQIYSIHAPGLPALVLPAFALAGYRGASLFLALLAAVGAGLLWRLSWRVTGGDSRAAWFGWAVAAFSAPFLFHAFTMYPDGAASVFLLVGVMALARATELSPARLVLQGAALAFLPWLHTRYALLAAALGLAILLRLARAPHAWRRAALFLAMPAAGAIAWFAFFYAIYGTPNPAAPYGTYTQSALANLPRGVMGLLFDQQFGLLATAPALIVSVVGLGWLAARHLRAAFPFARGAKSAAPASPVSLARSASPVVSGSPATMRPGAARSAAKAASSSSSSSSSTNVAADATLTAAVDAADTEASRSGRLMVELLCIITPYVLATATYHMWWGGWSAPARFLVPIVLPLGLPAALAWSRARTRSSHASALVALAAGLVLSFTFLLVDHGRFVYNDRDGFALWTDWASPVADLALGLPSAFREPRALFAPQVAVWVALLAVTWGALALWERQLERVATRTRDRTLAEAWSRTAPIYGAVITPVAFACAAMFAFSFTWSMAGVSGLRPDLSQLHLLDEIRDGGRPVVLDFAPRGRERPRGLLQRPQLESIDEATARISLVSATRRVPRPLPPFLAFDVPAGRYRLEPSITGRLAGRLEVFVGRSPVPIQSYDLDALAPSYAGQPLELPLTLAADVGMLTVRADDAARASVRQVRLYPVATSSRSDDEFPGLVAVQAARYHDVTLFAMTGHAYVEPGGWWVKPRAASPFLLTREQLGTTWPLVLRNGARPNRVTLAAGPWRRELTMAPGEEMTLEVPASSPRMGRTLGLVVRAEDGFRPSAVTKGSADHRLLGVWIGVP